jgi:hypothetical protein
MSLSSCAVAVRRAWSGPGSGATGRRTPGSCREVGGGESGVVVIARPRCRPTDGAEATCVRSPDILDRSRLPGPARTSLPRRGPTRPEPVSSGAGRRIRRGEKRSAILVPSSSGLPPGGGTAPVAQRIEHLTTDQKVRGSNPFGRAKVRALDGARPTGGRLTGWPRRTARKLRRWAMAGVRGGSNDASAMRGVLHPQARLYQRRRSPPARGPTASGRPPAMDSGPLAFRRLNAGDERPAAGV